MNRYKQKTEFKDTGHGHVRGYSGLTHTALQISEYIPKCQIYVEPFAGLGRVAKYVRSDKFMLNDMSDYAYGFLLKNFNAEITQLDFEECIRLYDGYNVMMVLDPPWKKSEYTEGCKGRAFCDRTPKEYYDKLFEILPTLKCNWILCGDKNNSRMKPKNSPYYTKIVEAMNKKIMGGKISTLLNSNVPFIRHHQKEL